MTTIAWDAISAPIIELPGYSLKDPALCFHNGWFHLVCSIFNENNYSQLGGWRSRDLAHWEGPLWRWGTAGDGWCSPDIIRHNNEWIMTFQSWDAIPPRESLNQVFYATSTDAEHWSEPQPLAHNLTTGVRAIDAALAFNGERWFVIYKEAQTPRLATAQQLQGPWELLPPPFDCWAENGQFINIDDRWHIVATLLDHEQGIAAMPVNADGSKPEHWHQWLPFQTMPTPVQPGFNDAHPANASSLWDGRALDGYWYRVFCAGKEPTTNNYGYQLGIARSRDLRDWELPG